MKDGIISNEIKKEIAEFCFRWNIIKMYLFGSILQETFSEDSDVDLIVEFSKQNEWNLLDFAAVTGH